LTSERGGKTIVALFGTARAHSSNAVSTKDGSSMRIGDVLTAISKHEVRDEWITATCPDCSAETNLGVAQVTEGAQQTDYSCGACGSVIVSVERIGRDAKMNVLGGMRLDFPPEAASH
jgi:ribosomal protein S27E